MPAPYEIIEGPITAWLAPVGSTFPDIDATPGAPWTTLGTSGNLNYMEDGLHIKHEDTVALFRALGSAAPRKAFRTAEGLKVSLVLADLSLEQYLVALNHNTVTTVAADVGVAGYKKLGLSRGLAVTQRALLCRAPVSAYGEGLNSQYEFPVTVQMGQPDVVYSKGVAAGLTLEWAVLIDPDAASDDEQLGRVLHQTADALT